MRNKYTEEFKRNAVALVQSGYGIRNIATKLGISPTSISHWIKDIRYMTGPTSDPELLLSQLPAGTDVPVTSELQLVKITAKEDFVPQADTRTGGVLVRYGKLRMEFRDGISKEMLKTLIRTLGESCVL